MASKSLEIRLVRTSDVVEAPLSRAEMARVSRAEMPPQVPGWMDQIGEIWDTGAEVSRAEFMRRLAQLVGKSGAFVGQVGQK
jgi:hypothetical protein